MRPQGDIFLFPSDTGLSMRSKDLFIDPTSRNIYSNGQYLMNATPFFAPNGD